MAGGSAVQTCELVGPAGPVVVNLSDKAKYIDKGYKEIGAEDEEEVEDEKPVKEKSDKDPVKEKPAKK